MIFKINKRTGRRSQTAAKTLTVLLACTSTALLAFAPAPALATEPMIEGETFSQVGPHGATLTAQVNPENLPGSYYYQYGPASTYSTAPSSTKPIAYEETPFSATAELTALEPNTEYEFQLIATNNNSETAKSLIMAFKTLPVTPAGLPDERVFEMVTPVENDNADVFVPQAEAILTANGAQTFQPFQVSPDGTAVTYLGDATLGGRGNTNNGLGNQYLARRSSAGGWVQSNIQPDGRLAGGYEGFSSDLSTGVLVSGGEPAPRPQPLAQGAPGEGYWILYACHESVSPCTVPEESFVTPQNPFQPLFTGSFSRSAGTFGTRGFESVNRGIDHSGKIVVAPVFGGSANMASRGLLFEANDALLHGEGRVEKELAASVASEITNNEDSNYLYDTVEGRLSLVDVLPAAEGGGVAGDTTFGGPPFPGNEFDPPDFDGVISGDGMRVYWTDLHTGVVYVRVGGVSTARVSEGAAQYWASAADGRYVFYTEGAVKGQEEGLYRFDAETDTRKQLVGPSGSVQGVVGTSESGEDVYFVANGKLAGTSSGGVLPQKGQPNLYLKHGEEEPVFIATLAPQDGYEVEPFHVSRDNQVGEYGDWQPALANRTAEVSAGGGSVVFMSSASLPVVGFPEGYPSSGGAENVYVFNADANKLFCVSCSASGEPSGASGFLPISWNDTYIPQWMADEGNRVFFDTGVSLVPQDTNGRQDVYEWEREGTGSCNPGDGVNGGCVFLLSGGTSKAASWLIGASASGNDVFIVTRAQLVPEDRNGADDLYDARVGGVRPVSPPACTGTGCQGVPAPPPTFATPPSVTFNGVGNFPPPAPATKQGSKPKAKPKAKPCKRGHTKRAKSCARKKGKAKRKLSPRPRVARRREGSKD
jgi:hypothetical protein